MSSPLSPPAWAIFLLVVAADALDPLGATVTGVAPPSTRPARAVTAACATSIPLPARRGAHAR
ncbi:hypothetical protein [Microbispora sp. H10836]|uniref:hypothetical protein n=1 Tax=Microbispora sp. H10836 TaxID=2729106 RepID=UPI001473A894|nr:hypothetical protein [Microbispora sp. H10836]